MCTIRERINPFAPLCNWVGELSNSIKELSNTASMQAIWKNYGIRELTNLIKELSNTLIKLN